APPPAPLFRVLPPPPGHTRGGGGPLSGGARAWGGPGAERQQADLYILLTPDAPWVDDDQRYFPDVGDRGRFFDECRALLDDIGAAYVTIDGPHEARLAKATSAVRDAFPGL
ncbi:MAG: hypothetical protein QF893_21450, partial [Alphaproteobacteria bacterium]|nr:hypothetical protein [Alphaproteobacteria bacterium]